MFVSLGKKPGQSRVNVIQPHPPLSKEKRCNVHLWGKKDYLDFPLLYNIISKTNNKSIFTQSSIEVIQNYIGKTCATFSTNQMQVKPLATRSLSFSSALYDLLVSTLGSDWLFEMFSFILTGRYYYLVLILSHLECAFPFCSYKI